MTEKVLNFRLARKPYLARMTNGGMGEKFREMCIHAGWCALYGYADINKQLDMTRNAQGSGIGRDGSLQISLL